MSRKRGRKRAENVERYPSGDRRPEPQELPAELVRIRSELLAELAMAHPQPHFEDLAKTADAGWHIGRLFILGQITEEQKFAAERLKRATRAYEAAMLIPQSPSGFTLLEPGGRSTESDEAHQKRYSRAKREYERLYSALTEAGRSVQMAVVGALREESVDLLLLRKGLEALRLG